MYVTREDSWYPLLFQRALFPRNALVVWRPPDDTRESLTAVRERYDIRFAIWQGRPPTHLEVARRHDLGVLPGFDVPTYLAELSP